MQTHIRRDGKSEWLLLFLEYFIHLQIIDQIPQEVYLSGRCFVQSTTEVDVINGMFVIYVCVCMIWML